MPDRTPQIKELLRERAADYLSLESNRTSLITVTRTDISPDLKRATIYLSVYPEQSEEIALAFARRHRSDFRIYLKKNTKLPHLPSVDFAIDYGEKNRQRLDALSEE